MTEKAKVGFIGLGYMGHGMAKNLVQKGHPLMVKGNRNRAPVDSLTAMGAVEAATPREMAEHCGVIHLCLSNSPQVEAVMRGPDGILAGAREGLIVIDTTTADPVSTLTLAAELQAKGCHMVDAPLGRTPKEAEAGTLDCMVGCDEALWARVQPIIACWAGNINRVGDVGAGHKMKLLMNTISMGYAALYAEVTVLGQKAGIAPEMVKQVIGSSRLGNGFFDTFMACVVDGDREVHRFSIANASKDLKYASNMAAEAEVMTLCLSAARQYFVHAEANGHAQDYVPWLADHVAALNGTTIKPKG